MITRLITLCILLMTLAACGNAPTRTTRQHNTDDCTHITSVNKHRCTQDSEFSTAGIVFHIHGSHVEALIPSKGPGRPIRWTAQKVEPGKNDGDLTFYFKGNANIPPGFDHPYYGRTSGRFVYTAAMHRLTFYRHRRRYVAMCRLARMGGEAVWDSKIECWDPSDKDIVTVPKPRSI